MTDLVCTYVYDLIILIVISFKITRWDPILFRDAFDSCHIAAATSTWFITRIILKHVDGVSVITIMDSSW